MTPSALSNETNQQIIAELQQAVSNWQRRAYAAEDELKRLTSASSVADPLSVGQDTLHPLADREKSAALITELQSYRSEGVTVKPLEWERTPGGAWEATPPYWADGYLVAEQIDDGGWYASDPESETLASGVTLREAKEACQIDFSERILAALQLDYETRIKSALSPSTERGETIEGWQPIETAPKDGKAFLVWCPDRFNTYLVIARFGLLEHFGPGADPLREKPTLWQPLPEPPRALNPSGSVERG